MNNDNIIKVCHMTSAHRSNDVRIFQKECVSLAAAGYEVYLVAPGENRTEKGVQVVGVGEKPAKRLQRMTAFAKKVYQTALELDCDIYHFHDPELLPYGLRLKRKGKKVIFDSHEDVPAQILDKAYLPKIVRKATSKSISLYEAFVLKRLDAVLYVSPHIRDTAIRYCPHNCLVANYPRLEEIYEETEAVSNTICFAGGITEQWNHETILRAIESEENAHYIFCGTGQPEYISTLSKYPAWRRAQYKGFVTHDESISLLRSGQIIMALCSYSANSGGKTGTLGNTKLFEAMAVSRPVICTDFELWKAIIEKYDSGICVNPKDPDEVANAIRYLIEHPDKAKQMGENGRIAVEKEFNWGVEEQKLLKMYSELLII